MIQDEHWKFELEQGGRLSTKTIFALVTLLSTIAPRSAQRVSEFLAVKGWQGSLKLKADYAGKLSGVAGVDEYSFSWSADRG